MTIKYEPSRAVLPRYAFLIVLVILAVWVGVTMVAIRFLDPSAVHNFLSMLGPK